MNADLCSGHGPLQAIQLHAMWRHPRARGLAVPSEHSVAQNARSQQPATAQSVQKTAQPLGSLDGLAARAGSMAQGPTLTI